MTSIIRTERLTKAYGPHRGIIDVDLEVEEGEVFGFLGPNGAGKTTTIRTLLDLIRPTSGEAFVFDIETTVDPVAIHRRIGYIPGEFALYDRLTGGQTIQYFANLRGGVDRGVPGEPRRAPRHRPEPQVQGALQGQQAEDRARDRAPAPAGAADPRRAHVRPRPARPADVLRARPRGAATRAARCSCRATSCPRSSAPATGSRSSATAGWSRSTASRPCATSPTTRWSCGSSTAVPDRRVRGAAGRVRRRRRGPHAPPARLRADHAGRPGGRPLRAARLRQPRAQPRGDVPRPVRPRPPTAPRRPRRWRHDRRRPGAPPFVPPKARPWSRIYGLGTVYAKTLRDSRLAVIIVGGLLARPAALERRGVRRGVQHAGVAPGARQPRQQPAAGDVRRLRQPVPRQHRDARRVDRLEDRARRWR